MQNIKYKPIFVSVLCFALVLSMLLGFMTLSASAATQSEIDSLQSERSELRSQQSQVQSSINALKNKQNSAIELKSALDEKNDLTMQQILNLNEQIDLTQELIEQKTKEVNAAQKVADKQLEKYKVRVRAMEENGSYNYLEVLLGANSIGEFLSLIDDIGDIMRSDKELENAYRKSVEELKEAKAEYETAQKDMKTKKAELVVLSDQLQKDIAEAASVISSLQGDINSNSAVLSSLSKEEAAIQAQINKKVAELEAQRKAEEAKKKQQEQQQKQQQSGGGNSSSGGKVVGSGNLIWPSSCTYITSIQGPRIHPVTGEYKNHGGTDVGASYGSVIMAADSGKVITSQDGWNGGWGNYVMIDHGNGMQTLYAHMSSRAVSVGQTVSRGQTIGYVGSTGMSTGAHLHYELYVNGSRVNPQNYYPNVSFSYSSSAR